MTNKKSARDWVIFMNIGDKRFSDVEKMTAIEHIAYAPTHNSITKAMMLDVIRYLLTAKQPRVLTLEEVPDAAFCYLEFKAYGTIEPAIFGEAFFDDTVAFTTLEDGRDYLDLSDYCKVWRCWTARPTDEQREATPWGEPPKEGDGE